jgi:hypothetical protein
MVKEDPDPKLVRKWDPKKIPLGSDPQKWLNNFVWAFFFFNFDVFIGIKLKLSLKV